MRPERVPESLDGGTLKFLESSALGNDGLREGVLDWKKTLGSRESTLLRISAALSGRVASAVLFLGFSLRSTPG